MTMVRRADRRRFCPAVIPRWNGSAKRIKSKEQHKMAFWDRSLRHFHRRHYRKLAALILSYALIQWFLRATDITVSYNWSFTGSNFYPNFDIRNRSGPRLTCWQILRTRETAGKKKFGSITIPYLDRSYLPEVFEGATTKLHPSRASATHNKPSALKLPCAFKMGVDFG